MEAICPSGNLTFFTSGDAEWYVDTDGTARSGAIGDSQSTSLSTTLIGPGTLSFRACSSSESSYDKLEVLLDGTSFASVSGERTWTQYQKSVPAGSHELVFRYSKDGSVANGRDCCWIDDVVWTPEGGS